MKVIPEDTDDENSIQKDMIDDENNDDNVECDISISI
eukprot:CAMPEP_0114671714 /NCGR_PEP_ID=MMETSP0191-20121206/41605_1 /TAXON_ID=126664 /ORGANISM="Sorites sp." /LENGTH=36 /DNA_ID= /DNA_START= /DNA_END= /DNA_ORIENTATION=